MTAPYRVVIDKNPCEACGKGITYTVVGPDDTGISDSWEGEEAENEAEARALQLNSAFELGRQSVQPGEAVLWRLMETDPPPGEDNVLVWDAELKMVVTFLWHADSLEHCRKQQYTHWRPSPPSPVPVLQAAPPADEPCDKMLGCMSVKGHAGECDDIPF